MKEFKSAHSRMFNKRRTNTAISADSSDAEEPVNNRNYSPPRMGAPGVGAQAQAALATTKSANNNGSKKGSISAIGSAAPVQIATAN